jgi:hypothetical protein
VAALALLKKFAHQDDFFARLAPVLTLYSNSIVYDTMVVCSGFYLALRILPVLHLSFDFQTQLDAQLVPVVMAVLTP